MRVTSKKMVPVEAHLKKPAAESLQRSPERLTFLLFQVSGAAQLAKI